MTSRGTCWSVTCNLKEISRDTVESCMDQARSLGWGIEGQLERGEQGTEHYQLMVKTPQVRFSALKKVFPTAHIELARNPVALAQYVTKEDSRVESLRPVSVTFLTYAQVRNKFFEWVIDRAPPFPEHDRRLELWDDFIGLSIEEGMECDLIGMNPQNRGCIAKYWRSYIARESLRRRTQDRRQSDSAETVVVPTI